MTPEFASQTRKFLPRAILVVLIIIMAFLGWKIVYGGGIHIPPLTDAIDDLMAVPPPPEPVVSNIVPIPDEWLVVNGNNVLLWPVVGGECRTKKALMQVHRQEKVLVVMRHDEYIEVELNNQSRPHTHGCIHGSLLSTEQ